MNKRQQKIFSKNRVFKAPIIVGRDTVTITLPKQAVEYLDLVGNELYWVPVNGVIQMSGNHPQMVIPMLIETEHGFIPHKKDKEPVAVEVED